MKYTSSILSAASGSIGGTTFSRNKGGNYVRTRAIPTNRRSAAQLTIRGLMGALANMWITLTAGNRASWQAYADNVLMPDSLGALRKISALAHYIRSNISRVYFLGWLKAVADAPVVYNLGATPVFGVGTATFNVTDDLILAVPFTIVDAPVVQDSDNIVEVFVSSPSDITNEFRKVSMHKIASHVVVDLASQPMALTDTVNLGYDIAGGQRMWIELAVSRKDGRLSSRGRYTLITAPYVP